MLHRILVPTDGSENAQRAERLGSEIAARFGAHLLFAHSVVEAPSNEELGEIGRVLHSIGPQAIAPLHMENLIEQVRGAVQSRKVHSRGDAMRELGRQMLERAEARAREAGVDDAESHLLHGDPGEAIVKLARQHDVDLIVIGTRGIGGLRGRLFGSVSKHVVNHAPQSTLVVKE